MYILSTHLLLSTPWMVLCSLLSRWLRSGWMPWNSFFCCLGSTFSPVVTLMRVLLTYFWAMGMLTTYLAMRGVTLYWETAW